MLVIDDQHRECDRIGTQRPLCAEIDTPDDLDIFQPVLEFRECLIAESAVTQNDLFEGRELLHGILDVIEILLLELFAAQVELGD